MRAPLILVLVRTRCSRTARCPTALIAGVAALLFSCGLSIVDTQDSGDRPEEDAATNLKTDGPNAPEEDAAPNDATPANDAPGADDDATTASDAALDATADAADAGTKVIAFVQRGQAATTGTNVVATIPATKAGDFLAVMVTMFQSASATVTNVTDNAPGGSSVFTSANLRSIVGTCQASEIWYTRVAKAGATSVTVTVSMSATLQLWVTEFSGLSATGGVDRGGVDSGVATTLVYAPTVTPTAAPTLIVNVTGSCGTVSGLHAGSPFTLLPVQNANGAAYFIAVDAGTYGPVFDTTNNGWNASTAAFR